MREHFRKTLYSLAAPLVRIASVGSVLFFLQIGCDRRSAASNAGESKDVVTLSWLFATGPDRPFIEDVVTRFEQAHPKIHIQMMWTPGGPQYQAKLKTLIAAGQSPDLFWCGDVWVPYMRPFLYDVTDLMARDNAELDVEDFYPALLRAGEWNGRTFLLPRKFNVSLLYYNVDVFRAGHESPPSAQWTWDDYVRAAQHLTQRDAKGNVSIWGSTIVTGWWGEWSILVRQTGGQIFNEQFTRCLLGSPEARRGLQFYFDKVYRYHIAPPLGRGPSAGFASGKFAMEFGGHTGNWPTYNAASGLDWDIQRLPKGPSGHGGGEVAIEGIGIARRCPHVEAAWTFLKFLLSPDNIQRQSEVSMLSVRRSVAQTIRKTRAPGARPKSIDVLYDAIEESEPAPQTPDFIEVTIEVIQPEIDLSIAGGRPMPQSIDAAVDATDAFLHTLGASGAGR